MRKLIKKQITIVIFTVFPFSLGAMLGVFQYSSLLGRWEGINYFKTKDYAYISHDILLFEINNITISSLIYNTEGDLVLSHEMKMHTTWPKFFGTKGIYNITSNSIKIHDRRLTNSKLTKRFQEYSVILPLIIKTCNKLIFSSRFGLNHGYTLLFSRPEKPSCYNHEN